MTPATLPQLPWRACLDMPSIAGAVHPKAVATNTLLPHAQVSLLLAEAVQHGLCTIAFCKTRKLSEMVAKYTVDTLRLTAPSLAAAVRVYRGGYTPAERRSIEAGLHGGTLWGVAATNALELGVDVGSLDVTLHLVSREHCALHMARRARGLPTGL